MRAIGFLLLFALLCLPGRLSPQDGSSPAGMVLPEYTESGELIRPVNFESWTFVGASIGLSYSATPSRTPPGLIHNVHMQPEAYRHYKQTGRFPEKTMLILTLYKPEQKASPNLHGYFQGELTATEVAVKDRERFPEGWAYFDFGGGEKLRATAARQANERCYSCHVKNGAVDNVFVQFYPVLRK
ncbi:MAG: cytochrome P460 family protein [Bryobacteraceae bacterium]